MKWPGPRDVFARYELECRAAIDTCLDKGLYILGPSVTSFEAEFAKVVSAPAAAGVATGTDALVLALRALGLRPGSRVATVSLTAVATVAAIELAECIPVLVDVDAETLTMSPESLARTAASVGGVEAVVPVHLYGHPCDMPAIIETARELNACVIEDCAQAHGATVSGRPVGSWGDAGAFSFYPTKNLGCLGDGGGVTGSSAIIDRVRRLRQYGWVDRYISAEAGMNSRLDSLQAAYLLALLPHLSELNEDRVRVANLYDAQLPDSIRLPRRPSHGTHVFHQYTVRTHARDSLLQNLLDAGVPAAVLYPAAVHQQPAYADRVAIDPAGLAQTESTVEHLLCLPMHPALTARHVDLVCEVVSAWSRRD